MTPPPEASVSGEDGLPPIDRAMLGLVVVTLDGRPVSSCLSYSVRQGFVRVAVTDAEGRALVDRTAASPEILTATAKGRVAVRLRDVIDDRQG